MTSMYFSTGSEDSLPTVCPYWIWESLVFELTPFLFHFMEYGEKTDVTGSITVVISSLVALMRSQVQDLCGRGMR